MRVNKVGGTAATGAHEHARYHFGKLVHVAEVAAVTIVVLFLGAPSLVYPFGRDQGEYAYIATAALHGKVIYRDVFNVKPPMTHIAHELALLAFGHTMLAIRILDLFWQSATAVIILFIARRACKRQSIGVLAAVLYALFYYQFGYWDTAQTDGFLTLPVALGVWAFIEARDGCWDWRYIACGLMTSIASLFKYPIGILAPLLALPPLWLARQHRVRAGVQILLGFSLPLLLCLVALARQNALQDFLFVQFNYIPQYTAGRGGDSYLIDVVRHLFLGNLSNIVLWLSAVALALETALAVRRRHLGQFSPVLIWWVAALASYAAQNKAYPYHALPLLAPISIIFAYLPFALREASPESRLIRLLAVGLGEATLLTLLTAHLTQAYPCDYRAVAEVVRGQTTLTALAENSAFIVPNGPDTYSMRAQVEVARYIDARLDPDDKIFVWGFEPTIYFLAHRDCASRFIYNYPLYGDFNWPQLKAVLIQELELERPQYLVVVRNDAIPWVTGTEEDSQAAIDGFPELGNLIASEYRVEAIIEDFTLYRRVESLTQRGTSRPSGVPLA